MVQSNWLLDDIYDGWCSGTMKGTYHTAPGGMTAPLLGLFDPSGVGAFGWTVSLAKRNSPSSSQQAGLQMLKPLTVLSQFRTHG